MTLVEELRQFGAAHNRNGERRTADLLFRAADHIVALEQGAAHERAGATKRNIISREEWDSLTQEHRALGAQLKHLRLPTQRGYRGKVEKRLYELSRRIRAVDGVIGIDA